MGYQIQNNSGYAFNPRSGQMEQLYAISPTDPLSGDYTDYRFESDGLTPQHQSLAGWAPGFYTDNSGTWSNFMERAVLGGLGAIGGVAAGSIIGGAAAGSGATGAAATDASTGLFAGESAAAGSGTYGTVGGGATGYGSAAAGGTAGAGTAVANGGGMDMTGWGSGFDASGYGGQQYDFTGLGSDFSADAFGGPQYDMTGWGSNFDASTGIGDTGGLNIPPGVWQQILNYGRGLFSNGKSIVPGANGSGGGLDAGKLLALAPVIAAIAHARSQGPFDTSRLESLYSRFDPNALAYDYDVNTGRGRNLLTSSLSDRGVMGSSFGNMDITNFNTNRELGRNALVNQGVGVAGGLANNILESQVKQRALQNDLYGRSLLALGNIFGGRPNYAT